MRVRQWYVHRIQHHRMAHFTPVGGDHVGRNRQPGSAAKFGHHLAARKSLLGAARIFRVGQHVAQPFAQRDSFIQQPGAVRIDGDACLREAFFQRAHAVNLLLAGQNAAFQLEVFEAVAILRRLCKAYHRLARERLLMTQVIPLVAARRAFQIRQIGFRPVANVEQIAQHRYRITLFAWPQQFADRHVQRLAQ